MRTRVGLAVALLGAGLVFGASNVSAQEKYYLGASIGQSKTSGFCNNALAAGATNCDENSTAWRFVGGYQATKNFAAELGYGQLANLTASAPRFDARIQVLELTAVGSYWFVPEIAAYAKLGVFNSFIRANTVGQGNQKDQNTNLTYGLGVRYDMNNQIAFRGEWQRYNDDPSVQVYSLGVLFKF